MVVELVTQGCDAELETEYVYIPEEIFLYKNFTINGTVNAYVQPATNVNVTLLLPTGWYATNTTPTGPFSVAVGEHKPVAWTVNATTYGAMNVTINATSGNAGDDVLVSNNFTVYREFINTTPDEPTIPQELAAGENLTAAQKEKAELEGGTEKVTTGEKPEQKQFETDTGLPDGVAATPEQANKMKGEMIISTVQQTGTPKQVTSVSQLMSPAIDQFTRDNLIKMFAEQETKLQTQDFNRLAKERRDAEELERIRTDQAES